MSVSAVTLPLSSPADGGERRSEPTKHSQTKHSQSSKSSWPPDSHSNVHQLLQCRHLLLLPHAAFNLLLLAPRRCRARLEADGCCHGCCCRLRETLRALPRSQRSASNSSSWQLPSCTSRAWSPSSPQLQRGDRRGCTSAEPRRSGAQQRCEQRQRNRRSDVNGEQRSGLRCEFGGLLDPQCQPYGYVNTHSTVHGGRI